MACDENAVKTSSKKEKQAAGKIQRKIEMSKLCNNRSLVRDAASRFADAISSTVKI